MSIKKRTIQGIFWSGIQNWGSQAGSFIIFLILARLLTPKDFGLVALANVFINFMQIFLNQGFTSALIQKQDINQKHIDTVFWIQVFIGFILAFFTFSAASLISNFFQQPKLEPIFQVFSVLFIINAFSQIQKTLLQRKFAFKIIALRSLLGILMAGIVGIYMAFSNYGVWSLVGQQFTYEVMGVIVLWKASQWRPKLQFSRKYIPELLNFSLNILGYKLVDFFNQRTDNLLIGYFLGEIALGYYAISHRILQVMTQLLIGTLNQVALSTFSRLQDDRNRFLEAFYRATQFTTLLALPVFCGTIILSSELVITLFGEKWLDAIPIIKILAFAGILRSVSFFQRSVFIAINQPSLQFKLGLLNTIFNVIACFIAVQWGILAVATAYVISDYLVFPISQVLLKKLISISWKTYLSQFLPPIICTLIMILTVMTVQQWLTPYVNPQVRLVICSITAIVIYSLTLISIFPNLFKQIRILVTLIQPLK